MKPLIEFEHRNKGTFFALAIYEVIDKIKKRADKWFNDVFIEKSSIFVAEEIHTRNFRLDVDYLLSEGIWLVELAKEQGLDVSDAERHLKDKYDKYTSSKDGHRFLVFNRRYDVHKNKLLTEKQAKKREERYNKEIAAILKKMKL